MFSIVTLIKIMLLLYITYVNVKMNEGGGTLSFDLISIISNYYTSLIFMT